MFGTSLIGLFKNFRQEFVSLIKQEIQLAKTEMSEKVSHAVRNAIGIAIGGFIAYAGVIVLLIGLGCLVAFAFQRLDISPLLAFAAGMGTVGLLIAAIGFALIMKGKSAFARETLAPEKTINSLREIGGAERIDFEKQKEEKKGHEEEYAPSSEQIEANIMRTQGHMKETMHVLNHKLNPRYIGENIQHRIQKSPRRAVLAAAGTGFLSAVLMARRRKAHS